MRDSAVMMSSTMPSAKYSCSGSPLMFWNGRTAIDGLSGSGSGGAFRRAEADAEHTGSLPAMFFSAGSPRSSTSSSSLSTRPRARGMRCRCRRAPRALQPRRDVHAVAHQVVALGARRRPDACRCAAAGRRPRRAIVSWIAMAQRSACTALANSTRKPSPVVLNSRPSCVAASGSITSVRSARTPRQRAGSSAPTMAE